MPSSAVVTGKLGPAVSVTAQTTTPMRSFDFNTVNQTLKVISIDDSEIIYDIAAATTFTLVLTSGNYVLTVS